MDLLKARLNGAEPLPALHLLSDMEQIRDMSEEDRQNYLRLAYQERVDEMEAVVQDIEVALGKHTDGAVRLLEGNTTSHEILPQNILQAVFRNDNATILEWLGPPPVAPERLNARSSPQSGDCSLLNATVVFDDNQSIMEMLLQLGADVDPKDCFGITPLCHACRILKGDAAARVLLQWGASKDPLNGALDLVQRADEFGKKELAHLLQTPLGGRRCELVGLDCCKELNGMTVIAGGYDGESDEYIVTLEHTNKDMKVGSIHLKRRDRTPDDPGDSNQEPERPRKAVRMEHFLSPTTKQKVLPS